MRTPEVLGAHAQFAVMFLRRYCRLRRRLMLPAV